MEKPIGKSAGKPFLSGIAGRGGRRTAGPDALEKEPDRNVWAGSDEKVHKKPHSTPEGQMASIKRAGKRFQDKTYKIEDYGDKSLETQWKAERKAKREKKKKKKFKTLVISHGDSEGYEDAKKIKGKPHSSASGRLVSRVRSSPTLVKFNKGGRSGYGSGGAVLSGKKVGIQIK